MALSILEMVLSNESARWFVNRFTQNMRNFRPKLALYHCKLPVWFRSFANYL